MLRGLKGILSHMLQTPEMHARNYVMHAVLIIGVRILSCFICT